MGQGQGNREDGVRPGSQGIRGFPWSPSLCGVPRFREGGMAGGQLAAVKARVDSFASWEELIMNETAAAPSNTEHELLLETGRFWSRYFFTSRHPHLPSALSSTSDRNGVLWFVGHSGSAEGCVINSRRTASTRLLTSYTSAVRVLAGGGSVSALQMVNFANA